MARLTPPIGATGKYTLKTPFVTIPLGNYSCKAIRTFDDIFKLNVDVFEQYYVPMGISAEDYELDRVAGACIITLISNNIGVELETDPAYQDSIIYVPDTYILKFPDGNAVPYSHIVLSLSLGALPDYLELTDVMADIADLASQKVGVVPAVKIHKALSTDIVSQEDSDIAEAGRQGAITNRETLFTNNIKLQNMYNELQERYDALEAAYIDLVTP